MPVSQKIEYKCREFQLQMIAMEINLTITMTYLQLEIRIAQQKPFEKDILSVNCNAKL